MNCVPVVDPIVGAYPLVVYVTLWTLLGFWSPAGLAVLAAWRRDLVIPVQTNLSIGVDIRSRVWDVVAV